MKPASKLRRRLLIVAVLFILFTLAGFFLAPVIVKSQLEKRASAMTGRKVTVEKVRVNPFALSVTLENFAIREPDGNATFLGWRRLYVNVAVLASVWKEWAVDEVVLEGFEAKVARRADGSLSFADILARLAPPGATPAPEARPGAKEKPGRPIRVAQFRVLAARVDFSDAAAAKPFATTLGPMTFALTGFRTVSERGAPYSFAAVTEAGEKLTWSGDLQAEPLRSSGEFVVENIDLAKYGPYHSHLSQADLASGTFSMRGRYDLNLTEGQRAMRLSDGTVQLRSVKVLERANQQAAVELPAVDITGINADALALKARVESVVLQGGAIHARREKDGTINLLAMLQPAGPPSAASRPAAPGAPSAPAPARAPASAPAPTSPPPKPDFQLGELALKDFRLDVSDLAAPRPAQLGLSGIGFSLRNVSLAEGATMPLQLNASWAPQGTVRAQGTVSILPVKADLALDIAAWELLPLSPYLEQFANARLTQGAFTSALKIQAAMPTGQPLAATVTGDVSVEKFGVVDGVHSEELAGFGAISVQGLRATTAPEMSVAIAEVNVNGPYARVVMNPDKTLNLAAVMKKSPEPAAPAASATPSAPAAAAPAKSEPPLKIEVAKVTIRDGDYRFNDRSLEPNVGLAISQFGGTVTGLSSAEMAKADLDLKASVNGSGPISIVGKINPLAATPAFDVKVDFKNVDLTPLSAYSGKYAGFELARGKLMLDVKAAMADNKIDAANVITLNQFTFGAPVKSPDATSLPVRLGVALLKDINGNIVIDVPVQGNTTDPSFSVGRVVLRVIVNLLTKAAVSPFSLLGAAFGGGGEELAFQEFSPGSADLQPGEMKKLETMVKALTNRPGLNLDLQGSYDSAADAFALKRQKLEDTVRRAAWEARRIQDPNIPPPERLVLTPEERGATLKRLFDEKFPPGTEFGTPLPQPPEVKAPPPPPRPGFLKRVVNVITFQSARQESAAKAEKERLDTEHAQAVAAAKATGLPVEEMIGRLADAVSVNDNDLRALADVRAQRVRDYFANEGKISGERLFLSKEPSPGATPTPSTGKGPRVFLSLQ